MDKDKNLKNSSKDSSLDTKVDEKKISENDNNSNSPVLQHDAKSSGCQANDESDNSSSNFDNFGLDLAVLNEVSKTAQMGMSTISFLANRINNYAMKKELVAIYSQYSNILLQVNQHFEKYGEVPEDTPARTKLMSFYGIKANLAKDKSNSHIAEMMIEGTMMGIIKCQKILNCNLDVDKSTIELIKKFNEFQRENINKLNAFL